MNTTENEYRHVICMFGRPEDRQGTRTVEVVLPSVLLEFDAAGEVIGGAINGLVPDSVLADSMKPAKKLPPAKSVQKRAKKANARKCAATRGNARP